MAHLISCRLLDEACTADDLATETDAFASKWEKIVWRTRKKKKQYGDNQCDVKIIVYAYTEADVAFPSLVKTN